MMTQVSLSIISERGQNTVEAGFVATGADHILQPDICNGEELARAGAWV